MREEFLLDVLERCRRHRARAPATIRAIAPSMPPARSIQASIASRSLIASPHHVLEGLVGGHHDRSGKRAAERAVGLRRTPPAALERQCVEQLRCGGLVEHLEARRDIGLERKLVQQPRAEGVDGLHLQPARRLQRRGEQPARPRALRRRRGLRPVDSAISLVERGVVERGPLRQRVEHAVRHVGGGRLGEGDAEDLGRIDAASSRRITRCASTWVLPEPALADTQAETSGSDGLDLPRAHVRRELCAGRSFARPRPRRR